MILKKFKTQCLKFFNLLCIRGCSIPGENYNEKLFFKNNTAIIDLFNLQPTPSPAGSVHNTYKKNNYLKQQTNGACNNALKKL